MRRKLPTLLLSGVAILSLSSILTSVHSAPRIALFREPTPGSTQVLRAFRKDVSATLDSPSFLFGGVGSEGPIEYQSPNRTSDLSKFDRTIVIGRTSYQELSADNNVVTQWGEGPLTSRLDDVFGPSRVKSTLRDILKLTSVRYALSGFTAKQIVPATDVAPGTPGQALLIWTVKVRDGHVISCRGTAYGYLQTFTVVHQTQLKAITVKSILLGTETYSRFGLIPQINAPPKRRTVELVPCKNGDKTDFGASGYNCGTYGT